MNGKKNLITRCINNLIDNSVKYANKVHIQISKSNNHNIIIIDDKTYWTKTFHKQSPFFTIIEIF